MTARTQELCGKNDNGPLYCKVGPKTSKGEKRIKVLASEYWLATCQQSKCLDNLINPSASVIRVVNFETERSKCLFK